MERLIHRKDNDDMINLRFVKKAEMYQNVGYYELFDANDNFLGTVTKNEFEGNEHIVQIMPPPFPMTIASKGEDDGEKWTHNDDIIALALCADGRVRFLVYENSEKAFNLVDEYGNGDYFGYGKSFMGIERGSGASLVVEKDGV